MTTIAIIVAAGRGLRAGGGVPKQWRMVAGQRVVDRSCQIFVDNPSVDHVVLVIHPDDHGLASDISDVEIVLGGASRNQSVFNGLTAVKSKDPKLVLIHDVARPCVSGAVIENVLTGLTLAKGAAPALPVSDALWRGEGLSVQSTQSRDGLFRAQTPQGFSYKKIHKKHNKENVCE